MLFNGLGCLNQLTINTLIIIYGMWIHMPVNEMLHICGNGYVVI